MAIVVPKRIYVDYQSRTEHGEIVKLGFATYADTKDSAFLKRKATIDHWASTTEYGPRYQDEDGKWHRDPLPKPFNAEFIDNEPQSGFKIPRHVRRWGWNGGNVLWRIEDPRGFELEIPSENMGQLLMHCTIVNGEIQEQCVWGWNKKGGSRVVLLPINSEPYQQALNDTLLHNSKVSIRDVNIGDRVVLKNGVEGIFYGGHYILFTEYMTNQSTRNGYGHRQRQRSDVPVIDADGVLSDGFDGKQVECKRKHVLKLDSGHWYVQSSFKVALIKERSDILIKPEQAREEIEQSIASGGSLTDTADKNSYRFRQGTGEIAIVDNKNTRGKLLLVPSTIDEITQAFKNNKGYSVSIVRYSPTLKDYFLSYVNEHELERAEYDVMGPQPRKMWVDFIDRGYIITDSRISPNISKTVRDEQRVTMNPNHHYYLLKYEINGRKVIIS